MVSPTTKKPPITSMSGFFCCGAFHKTHGVLLHNSLNRNRFKVKIMQQIKSVTASFVRHIWRTAL
ncbi:hypothetical protein FB480_10253 [Agrobacterium vitis]|nr:hypothetical protein FB480_10253 [Agrobacterium vitis]